MQCCLWDGIGFDRGNFPSAEPKNPVCSSTSLISETLSLLPIKYWPVLSFIPWYWGLRLISVVLILALFLSLKRTTDMMFGGKQVVVCGYGEVKL